MRHIKSVVLLKFMLHFVFLSIWILRLMLFSMNWKGEALRERLEHDLGIVAAPQKL